MAGQFGETATTRPTASIAHSRIRRCSSRGFWPVPVTGSGNHSAVGSEIKRDIPRSSASSGPNLIETAPNLNLVFLALRALEPPY